jgi:hypothetical protein
VSHWTEPPTAVNRALEVVTAASFWQRRSWRRALRRLREELEADAPRVERIAVAGGNRYATGVP